MVDGILHTVNDLCAWSDHQLQMVLSIFKLKVFNLWIIESDNPLAQCILILSFVLQFKSI
jgi:hypothetical protein